MSTMMLALRANGSALSRGRHSSGVRPGGGRFAQRVQCRAVVAGEEDTVVWRQRSSVNVEWLLRREGASEAAIRASKKAPRDLRWVQADTLQEGWELRIPLPKGDWEVVRLPSNKEGVVEAGKDLPAPPFTRRAFWEPGESYVIQTHGLAGTEWVKARPGDAEGEMLVEVTYLGNDGSSPQTSLLVLERAATGPGGTVELGHSGRPSRGPVGVGSRCKDSGLAGAVAFDEFTLVFSYNAPPDFSETALQDLRDRHPDRTRPKVTVFVRVDEGGLADGLKMLLSPGCTGLRRDLEKEAVELGDLVMRNAARRTARKALDRLPGGELVESLLPTIGGLPVPYVLPTGRGGAVGGVGRISDLMRAAIPALDAEEETVAMSIVEMASVGVGGDVGSLLNGEVAFNRIVRTASAALQAVQASGRAPALLESPEAAALGTLLADLLGLPAGPRPPMDGNARDLVDAASALTDEEMAVISSTVARVATAMYGRTIDRLERA